MDELIEPEFELFYRLKGSYGISKNNLESKKKSLEFDRTLGF